MKFCPHCGTTFEPDARFCLECGFDRSSVEPVELPSNSVPEVVANPTLDISAKPGCPQCGTELAPDDRFCQECGFDTTAIVLPEIELPIQPADIEENFIPPLAVEQPASIATDKQICPQCGSAIDLADRYCEDCGYDTNTAKTIPLEETEAKLHKDTLEPIIPPVLTEEPISIEVTRQFCPRCGSGFNPADRFCDECGFDTVAGVVEPETTSQPKNVPPLVSQPDPVIPPLPKPAPPSVAPANVPSAINQAPTSQQKSKKSWLRALIVLLGLAVLGAGGWYGYNEFLANKSAVISDSVATTIIPEPAVIDTSSLVNDAIEQDETSPEPAKTTTKPLSRVDQELAKQKAKQQKSTPQQTTTNPVQPAKPDMSVKVISNPTAGDNMAKVIMEVGRKEDPKHQKPKNPAKLVLLNPTMIVRITTDHYNNGMGTPVGGTISIKDRDGNLIGTYRTTGRSGANGAPNSKWVAEPHKLLDKGTYFIWDSDFSTWSKTFMGSGFISVEGYEVK